MFCWQTPRQQAGTRPRQLGLRLQLDTPRRAWDCGWGWGSGEAASQLREKGRTHGSASVVFLTEMAGNLTEMAGNISHPETRGER